LRGKGTFLKKSNPPPQSAQVRFMRTLLVSADLTADEIPATGGHRRFVPFQESRKGDFPIIAFID
jgi:hypothetical protein